MIDLTSSGDKASRALAAWLQGHRPLPLSRSTPAPLVLFVCHSNTALSIMAEAILRQLAQDRVRVGSAGVSPRAQVDPHALECLRNQGIATSGLRSKGYDGFFGVYRIPVRFLIMLSAVDQARAPWERSPTRPTKAHWDMPDPTAVAGSDVDIRMAFERAFATLDVRIRQFLTLPLEYLDGRALTQELEQIGQVWQ